MKIRCEGEGVEMTHLWKILNGVRLDRFEFNTNFSIAMMGNKKAPIYPIDIP
jgi:hypothetical protein